MKNLVLPLIFLSFISCAPSQKNSNDALELIEKNNFNDLVTLIEKDPSVLEEKDKNQNTLLHYTTLNFHPRLKSETFFITYSDKPFRALNRKEKAILDKKIQIITYLLDKGLNPNAKNKYGFTPLHYAVFNHFNPLIEILLTHGANPNIQTSTGSTPLHFAVMEGDIPITEMLLDYNADPNITNIRGESSLHISAKYGTAQTMQDLLDHDASVNLLNNDGETPVYNLSEGLAMQKLNPEILFILLKSGANVNIASKYLYRTPLHIAALSEYKSDDLVNFLIEAGADLDAKDKQGHTPYDLNQRKGIKLNIPANKNN